jgi:hypothetical protein
MRTLLARLLRRALRRPDTELKFTPLHEGTVLTQVRIARPEPLRVPVGIDEEVDAEIEAALTWHGAPKGWH